MSWSVSAVGRPAKVKEVLATQFANAKQSTQHIPAEQASVEQVEALFNNLLDFSVENELGVVSVSASGSASKKSGTYNGSVSTTVSFAPIYGFVE